MGALELRDVEYRYNGTFTALRNVSFDAQPGEFICIVGPSGCGKSTLLDLVDGLAAPTRGTVSIGGQVITRPGADRAMVFQAHGLLPWRTVAGNIAFALEASERDDLRNEPKAQRRERIHRLIQLVGLGGFADFFPGALSGGMRQRVNLARALAVEPQILLMDEPFAALDAQTRDVMQVELLRVWQQRQATVLFVTHSIQEAVFLADRVIVISGRPGTVKRTVPILLPRPRHPDVRRTPEFHQYEQQISEEIDHVQDAG